uniref:dual specificity calcium/calmodulin-dependent 3',5'-cyclic nucleotide phosphodiesterase 1A-like n=1 Tax=Myxine glutinosa TaxID=7769 RepID=UPI00358F0D58
MGLMLKRSEERPRFRSIVHAVQAGIFVERMYRRTSSMIGLNYPPGVISVLKNIDKWSFNVFALNEASGDHALKFIVYDLLTRYDLIARFKIAVSSVLSFVEALEAGYSKHKNPYHNALHAADVTQTVHYLMLRTGIVHCLTELEIFSLIFAAAIHDYDHTGTTNNFHIQTRSDTAILYNDRSVLENHHVSAAYRLMQEDEEMNILMGLSKDDWREFRVLVVEMVLATDMSGHFQQIKLMRNGIQQPEGLDKPKAMSLMLHTADISHPAKVWDLHHRWTSSLLEEFFQQGDKEAELGLPFSPLCDRKSTMVAQSQIDGKRWYRSTCKTRQSIRQGSWFEGSHLSLHNLLIISYCWAYDYPQKAIAREASCDKTKTVVDCANFHREVCEQFLETNPSEIGGIDERTGEPIVVQVDESKFFHRKYHRGQWREGQWVFGGIERSSHKCFLVIVPDRTEQTLRDLTLQWILPGSHIITDGWRAYNNVDDWAHGIYTHGTIIHQENFVNPLDQDVHTQNVENMWMRAKRKIRRQFASTCGLKIRFSASGRNRLQISEVNALYFKPTRRRYHSLAFWDFTEDTPELLPLSPRPRRDLACFFISPTTRVWPLFDTQHPSRLRQSFAPFG